MKRKNYLVAYDISNNTKRKKVSDALMKMGGYRINKSVFIMVQTQLVSSKIVKSIAPHVKKTDSVYILPMCKKCLNGGIHLQNIEENKRKKKTTFV